MDKMPVLSAAVLKGISTGSIQIYLRRVDDDYNDFNTSVYVDGFPYTDPVANKYRNDWMLAFLRWKEFFDENATDWIISDDTYDEATEYHRILKEFRKKFPSAFGGKKPSGGDSPIPKKVEDQEAETSSMDVYVPLAFGVAAVVAIGYLVRSVR